MVTKFNRLILQWQKSNAGKNGTGIYYPIAFTTKWFASVGTYHGDTTSGSSGPLSISGSTKTKFDYYGSETFKNDYKYFLTLGY